MITPKNGHNTHGFSFQLYLHFHPEEYRGGCIKVRIQIKPKYKLNPAKPFKSELIFNSSPIWDITQIEKWLKTIIRGTGLVKAQFDINNFFLSTRKHSICAICLDLPKRRRYRVSKNPWLTSNHSLHVWIGQCILDSGHPVYWRWFGGCKKGI